MSQVLLGQIVISATYAIDNNENQILITPSKITGLSMQFKKRKLLLNDTFIRDIPDDVIEVDLSDFEFYAGDKIEIWGEN